MTEDRWVALAVVVLIGVIAIGLVSETKQMAIRCEVALAGVEPVDSLRVYVVQPDCLP